MDNTDKKKFAELLLLAAEVTGFKMADSTNKSYFAVLKNITIEQFESAINAHLVDPNEGMFFPKPANIMRQLHGTTKQQDAEQESLAELQWMRVESAIRLTGSHNTPRFKDAITAAVISSMGTWPDLCATSIEQLVWKRKDFIRMYNDFKHKPMHLLPNNISGREDLQQARMEGTRTLSELMDKVETNAPK